VPPPLEDDYRLPDNCVTYFVAGILCRSSAFVVVCL